MASTRKPGTPKIAFLLDEKSFRQLVALIEDLTSSESLDYSVRLSDGSSVTFDSADEVLSVQNSRERQITSIWIDTAYRSEPRIEVKFQAARYLDPVEYQVSGNEKDVFHASARLDEYFSGLRQWYSLIVSAGFKMYYVYIAIMFPIAIFFSLWLGDLIGIDFTSDAGNSDDDHSSFREVALVTLWLIAPGVTVPVGASLLDRIRRWLFPKGTFAIGNGVDRHDKTVAARKLFGGGILLALAVSLLGSWVFSQLS